MERRMLLTFVVAAAMTLGAGAGTAAARSVAGPHRHGGLPLHATLLPGSETPPHDTAARGSARITVNPGHDQVCWKITFSDLSAPASAAHIHQAPVGVAGSIVLPTPVPAVTSGTGTGCATVSDALAQGLKTNPDAYYVNVHDSVFPAGEIRGQLSH
jgi:hypothetical protein